jgi:hypothetical protein
MRRKAFPFRAPAKVVPESVVGIVVAHGGPTSVDQGTLELSTRVIVGHLRILGLELIPAQASRHRWRRQRTKEVHNERNAH